MTDFINRAAQAFTQLSEASHDINWIERPKSHTWLFLPNENICVCRECGKRVVDYEDDWTMCSG